jgi:hypothetical protein
MLPRHARRRIFAAAFGSAAAAHVSRGQIENSGAVAGKGHPQQRAAAGLLDVIRMRGQRQDVERSADAR